jgi:uncharacterized membrane protein YfcA
MSEFFWFILAGAVGGVLGGMGMGGGVLLIPALTVLLDVGQKTAQGVNLIAFIPMSIVALVIHVRNKKVVWRDLLWIILPACLACAGGSLLAVESPSKTLRICYGIFLTLLGIAQGVVAIVNMVKDSKSRSEAYAQNIRNKSK